MHISQKLLRMMPMTLNIREMHSIEKCIFYFQKKKGDDNFQNYFTERKILK